jgi:hypothetical protein
MRMALLTTFAASKKEPLAALLERIYTAFLASGLGEPFAYFSFSDAPVAGTVSSIDRALKRFPVLERFLSAGTVMLGGPAIKQVSNGLGFPGAGEALDFATMLAIAAGVPRSFPFHAVTISLSTPAFGDFPTTAGFPAGAPAAMLAALGALISPPGVTIGDSWWVNGRQRSLSALTIVDADPAGKKLPGPPEAVAAVLATCGKAKSTKQLPLPNGPAPATAAVSPDPPAQKAEISPEAVLAVQAVVREYQDRLGETIDRAALPHDLPPASEALKAPGAFEATGPKKPVQTRAYMHLQTLGL